MLRHFMADDDKPTDDQEYEDLLISVATRIAMILSDADDEDDPDPESILQ